MFALYCIGFVLTLSAGVTFFAVVSAKDGYEDQLGFHRLSSTPNMPNNDGSKRGAEAPLPPCTAAS
jgi:hypothetical protein